MTSANRLIIDCSHAFRRSQRAGVQRVVWNLIEQAMDMRGEASTRFHPASAERSTGPYASVGGLNAEVALVLDGQFWAYDPRRPLKSACMRQDIFSCLPRWYKPAAEWLVRSTSTRPAAANSAATRKLERWLLPTSGKLGLFRLWHALQEKLDLRRLTAQTEWRKPGKGDVLLMADGYWCRKQVWPAVEEARRRGVTVITIMYDLIPITHPHFVRPGSQPAFEEYFQLAVKHSDVLIAISQFVADECRAEIQRRWPERLSNLRIGHFRLGANLPQSTGKLSTEIRQLFDQQSTSTPYLMVSTFDPRKNHAVLMAGFERVWQQLPNARLCLVGSTGWMCEQLIADIESHPRFNRQLFKFHALDDAHLKYCYENARGVMCPSYVEGFGLSVVEALAHGRRTFVSDIPVHREVGGRDCHYFKPDDAEELSEMILDWEKMLAGGAPLEQPVRPPTNWQESARDLFIQCANYSGIPLCDATPIASRSKSA